MDFRRGTVRITAAGLDTSPIPLAFQKRREPPDLPNAGDLEGRERGHLASVRQGEAA